VASAPQSPPSSASASPSLCPCQMDSSQRLQATPNPCVLKQLRNLALKMGFRLPPSSAAPRFSLTAGPPRHRRPAPTNSPGVIGPGCAVKSRHPVRHAIFAGSRPSPDRSSSKIADGDLLEQRPVPAFPTPEIVIIALRRSVTSVRKSLQVQQTVRRHCAPRRTFSLIHFTLPSRQRHFRLEIGDTIALPQFKEKLLATAPPLT